MVLKNDKSLGQHWLRDRESLAEIADLAAASSAGLCIEIGPGLGTLTSHLLKRFYKVIAIEFDPRLAENLPKSFPGKNLEVIHADILNFDFSAITEPFAVAGNIPYYITSPIIDKLLSLNPTPTVISLLIQKEVAERIAAGSGHHSVLSLMTENRAEINLGSVIGKELFTPPPKVDSKIIQLIPREQPLVPDSAIALAKLGFSSPRKKLIKNLTATLQLSKEQISAAFAKIDLDQDSRPADLPLKTWATLATILTK